MRHGKPEGRNIIGQMAITSKELENLYRKYNRWEYVHPDPLEFLYEYKELKDREIAGLVASSLAYGRVGQILASVHSALRKMGNSPFDYVIHSSAASADSDFAGFRHRFSTGAELSRMLLGAKKIILEYGSLQNCFSSGMRKKDETILPALLSFLKILCGNLPSSLLPCPEKKSALKRMNLFLRWMARKDDVDPGGWDDVPASKLIIPLDTHMHGIGLKLGFTKRKQADMATALEITSAFRIISPDDPAKYDFCLTRAGIRGEKGVQKEISRLQAKVQLC